MNKIQLPISADKIETLHVGDLVSIDGVMVTARDAAHKYLFENYVHGTLPAEEKPYADKLYPLLKDGFIYHCGPIVRQDDQGHWHFVAAGPTTSIREEPYQGEIIEHFGVRGVIGKGGMGEKTLEACRHSKAVYLHAVGGAASLLASHVKEVIDVFKHDVFGLPEGFWVIRVEDFPAVVTIDCHGESLHRAVQDNSDAQFARLVDEIPDD